MTRERNEKNKQTNKRKKEKETIKKAEKKEKEKSTPCITSFQEIFWSKLFVLEICEWNQQTDWKHFLSTEIRYQLFKIGGNQIRHARYINVHLYITYIRYLKTGGWERGGCCNRCFMLPPKYNKDWRVIKNEWIPPYN